MVTREENTVVLRYRQCIVVASTHPRLIPRWSLRGCCGWQGQFKNGICDHHRELNRRLGLEGALSLVPLDAPEGALSVAETGSLSHAEGEW